MTQNVGMGWNPTELLRKQFGGAPISARRFQIVGRSSERFRWYMERMR